MNRFALQLVATVVGSFVVPYAKMGLEGIAKAVTDKVGAAAADKTTGVARAITASDVAILFRTRDSHREFEAALERHGIGAYVYKGLGFFDADEIKDVLALLWYLAEPLSGP